MSKKEEKITVRDGFEHIERSRLIVVKGDFDPSSEISIVTLTHPGLGRKANFAIDRSSGKMYEMQKFEDPNRCWMVNQTIRTDGNLYIFTAFDPLFIVLPHVISHCFSRAVPLDHILNGSDDPELGQLTEIVKDLSVIADMKGSKNLSAYKYNEEKTLSWLKNKIHRVADELKKKNISSGDGAVSASFVRSSSANGETNNDSLVRYAFGIVSQYLEEDLSDLLLKSLDLKDESLESGKRKSEADESRNGGKRLKTEDVTNLLSERSFNFESVERKKPSPVKKTPSAKSKLDKRAAVGSKSISCFFNKK